MELEETMTARKLEIAQLKDQLVQWKTEKERLTKLYSTAATKLETETRLRIDFENKISVLTNDNRRLVHAYNTIHSKIKDNETLARD